MAGKICVPVPFEPLLQKIALAAGCNEPEVVGPSDGDCRCSIVIREKSSGLPIYSACERHDYGDYEDSRRLACRDAIMALIQKFKICVRDVNFERLHACRMSSRLFRAKRHQAEAVRGVVSAELSCPCVEAPGEYVTEVSTDFIDVLEGIDQQLGLLIGKIEAHFVTEGHFVAWVSIPTGRPNERRYWLISKPCPSSIAAREDVARVAISMLQMFYGFEVSDISDFMLPTAYEECYNEMEAYYKAEADYRAYDGSAV